MPYKDKEQGRERNKKYHKIWYQKNKERTKNDVFLRKQKIKKWFLEYKSDLACNRCGDKHPAIIDFHHENSDEKEANIAKLVANGYSIDSILEEIKKCEVVCSNCHRKIHYNERNDCLLV